MKDIKIGPLFFKNRTVHYEGGAVSVHARSLWRLETLRVAWVAPLNAAHVPLPRGAWLGTSKRSADSGSLSFLCPSCRYWSFRSPRSPGGRAAAFVFSLIGFCGIISSGQYIPRHKRLLGASKVGLETSLSLSLVLASSGPNLLEAPVGQSPEREPGH